MPNAGNNKTKHLRYFWVVATLAVLGIILSPISPFSLWQEGSSSPTRQLPEPPQPEELSEEDLLDCSSLLPGVQYIIGGEEVGEETFEEESVGNSTSTTLTEEEILASQSLVGEFCNRPALVRNMSFAYDPTISLVAYGCDAALEKIGDAALQDSLGPFAKFYCPSVTETIFSEINSLIESAQSFKTETIPELRQISENEGNSSNAAVLQNAESVVDETIEKANTAKELLISGSIYDAARSLDEALVLFTGMIESSEMSALLGLGD